MRVPNGSQKEAEAFGNTLACAKGRKLQKNEQFSRMAKSYHTENYHGYRRDDAELSGENVLAMAFFSENFQKNVNFQELYL